MRALYIFLCSCLMFSCKETLSSKSKSEISAKVEKTKPKVNVENLENEPIRITVTKNTKTFEASDLKFEVQWDEKLSYSDNIGYYGGIKSLGIYRNGAFVNSLENIEDNIALGAMYFTLQDYNLDGVLDFKIPLNEKYHMYFMYNQKTKTYVHAIDWDYLRDFMLDKAKMQLTTNSYDSEISVYQIKGIRLIQIQ